MAMRAENEARRDKVFYVETTLGLIATARSIVVADALKNGNKDHNRNVQSFLTTASKYTYDGGYSETLVKLLTAFISSRDYVALLESGKRALRIK